MTETIRYSLIGKEDIKLEPRDGRFEVTLPDGSVVVLSALDVAYLLADAYLSSEVPSNLAVGQLYRLKDGIRGLWEINQSGFAFGLNNEQVNLKEFGAVGDGLTDCTSALNAAIAALATTGGVIVAPQGTYRFLSAPNALGAGIIIQGAGIASPTSGYGTKFVADYLEGTAANGFLTWDGSSGTGAGLGGGVRDLTIYKASGQSGGTAIKFTGTTDNLRAGLNVTARAVVTGGGTWSHALLVDGSGLTTSGNQGIRATYLSDVRFDNCDVLDKTIWLKNATEFMGHGVRVSQGNGANTSGITVSGSATVNDGSRDVTFAALLCEGDFVTDYATNVSLQGTIGGTVSVSANTTNFKYDGPVAALGSISSACTTATFDTQIGQYQGGPYMRMLTNQTGVDLVAGDVVALDSANDSAVTLQDSSAALFTYVVAAAAVTSGSKGPFVYDGIWTVNVTGTVTRGHYIRKSSTTKVAEDTGTAEGAAQSPPVGAIGVALSNDSGGQITAFLFGAQAVTAAAAGTSFSITSATQDVTTSETTTSTSYTNLATTGPAVTLSPGSSTTQIILVSATQALNGGAGGDTTYASVSIAGAAASDNDAGQAGGGNNQTRPILASGVGNGSTHTMKYRVTAGTGTFSKRRLIAFTIT